MVFNHLSVIGGLIIALWMTYILKIVQGKQNLLCIMSDEVLAGVAVLVLVNTLITPEDRETKQSPL